MPSPSGLVVGTAGHIDHGKTTLVYALTGIKTDTRKDEQERGISIDLGFANLVLPGCPPIGFIDVPGHERFIKNMLAGAAGIQAVMLVVAADESVKPQTREHFAICRLLGLRSGIVVLTKSDLATPEQLEKTKADVRELVAGSFLQNAPVIPVSAATGDGLDALRSLLSQLSTRHTPPATNGIFRLSIDRNFALKGFGAVVTGTLNGGSLRVGDSVQVYPQNIAARVRGLQVHHASVAVATAGQRVAVNLSGVEHTAVCRGSVIAPPGLLETTSTLDVSVDWLDPLHAPHQRQEIFFHSGTSEVLAVMKMNAAPSQGTLPTARLRLSEPVLVLPGDRFVMRRPSPAQTLAGGSIIDAFPPRRISRAKSAARLTALSLASHLAARLHILVSESPSGISIQDLVRMTGAPAVEIQQAAVSHPDLLVTPSGFVLTRSWIDHKRQALTQWLRDFHAKNPGAAGAPLSLARMGLEAPLADAVFTDFPAIRIQGDLVALAAHRAAFSAADTQLMQKIEDAFRGSGFQPPSPVEVLQNSGGGKRAVQLLDVLIKSQRLVRISADLIFHADVVAHIRNSLASHKGRRFSVPEFKSWTSISRKFAIPLLEYLDNQHVTKREGDTRIVL